MTDPPDYNWELVQVDDVHKLESEQLVHINAIIAQILELEKNGHCSETINIEFQYKKIRIGVLKEKETSRIAKCLKIAGGIVLDHPLKLACVLWALAVKS